MRKIITTMFLFLFLLFISCASAVQNEITVPDLPKRQGACEEYKGNQWTKCVVKQYSIWELRESSKPVVSVEKGVREGDHINKSIIICRAGFCSLITMREYAPRFWTQVKERASYVILGLGIGALAVVSNGMTVAEYFVFALF